MKDRKMMLKILETEISTDGNNIKIASLEEEKIAGDEMVFVKRTPVR